MRFREGPGGHGLAPWRHFQQAEKTLRLDDKRKTLLHAAPGYFSLRSDRTIWCMKHWLLQVLIAIDQLFTALLGGWADETLSSYAWRLEQQGKPFGFTRQMIDALFFWQKDHCRKSYEDERSRAQLPPVFRS